MFVDVELLLQGFVGTDDNQNRLRGSAGFGLVAVQI
jgi:hypothetical protein